MAHDVFICHAHDDKPVADAACASLEARRIRCWIAPRDVSPGRDYAEAIVEAIGTTQIVVLVFSENANRSPHVKREIERAVSRGLPILPVRVDRAKPSASLEYFISGAHWLDAMTPPLEAHLSRLADTVETLLQREAPAEAPAGAPPAAGTGPSAATEPPPRGGLNRTAVIGAAAAGVVAILLAVVLIGNLSDDSSAGSTSSSAAPATSATSATTTVPSTTAAPVDDDPFAEIVGPDSVQIGVAAFFDIAGKRNVVRAVWIAPWGAQFEDDGTGFRINVEACEDPCTLRLTAYNGSGESYETAKVLEVIRG